MKSENKIDWDNPVMKALDEKGFNPGKVIYYATTPPYGTRVIVTETYPYYGVMKDRIGTIVRPGRGDRPKQVHAYRVLWDGAPKPVWYNADYLRRA